MALDPKAESARALHRFGFGSRGNTIADIAGDPRGAVLADLERPSAGRITNPDLPTSAQAARAASPPGKRRSAGRRWARPIRGRARIKRTARQRARMQA